MKLHLLITLIITLTVYSPGKAQKILFLGNSLTCANNLPQILEYLAKDFDEPVQTTVLCFPNYALEDHWNDGKFQKIMSEESFNYVIVQQGPSSQPPGKQMLVDYGAKIKSICKEKGASLAYFMVWPSKQYYFTFDRVIANHKYAAKTNESILFPVGIIWKKYEENKNKENLYSYDNFHPSTAGSFLAALTIFHGLYPERNLLGLRFKRYKRWVNDEDSFNAMIRLISE